MFACVSPHFHKDVIFREREFDLEYLAFFRDVYLIQDTELTFPPFSTHYLHCRFLRGIMWHAMLWKKVTGAKRFQGLEWRVGPSQKENIFCFANWQRKTVPPSPLFHREKFKSTEHISALLSRSSIRWELGVFSLICIWRKWVVVSWMTPIALLRKVLGKCQVGLCDFWQETRVAGVAISLFSSAAVREC